ncbi:hypothetical protein I3843_04G032400 [Carya illinoinensis]|uniref:Uncharacterized protein n=2 Tax=Carya illinoinensis TaxID=32201 RepID=A0A8T1QP33_CARIL|nr:ankyrin repeat and protein kinase domain-containing protein 1-like [Carya illinoinensis]KAG6656608.1 hypothetical protein CIPAW_04G033700 [Carya illinoinensis]KAG6716168.1 hypothetical protein I3842_04G033800 [Carya illinoinensis]KAG7982098.1 hypothetical protein I3843_04G032400 [Carya illinoinensis]
MPPTYFPLRWESTGDQWWYASPIDWAAANGHYDLVRELLRIDSNHLIKLASLRRIRRLETVWDDEQQFDDVAKCRSQVARKLFVECESKRGKNSLIRAGYGGWLMYTAASAGDLDFVQDLLERNPLLVFGEGEYGVTDILYAAARSKISEVFRLILNFAVSPRFLTGKGGELIEHIGEVPSDYKWEMMNRAVHAAARGGNLKILRYLLADCSSILVYRDIQGSTILHAAAGKGQIEVIKYLISTFDIFNSTDNQGNTALHVAAYKGQLAAVEALISASPSSISLKNSSGETFLHKAVSGFQTPAFRRLDRQIELMKNLVCGKLFTIEDVINVQNNDKRTALHMAIIGNVHSDLVKLLMTAKSINVNACDAEGLTPLDYLRQRPRSASSDILIRQLISAGATFCSQDYTARRAIASRIKMQGIGGSPGTSFRISDTEIFLYTGIENALDETADEDNAVMSISPMEPSPDHSINQKNSSPINKRPSSANTAAQRLKSVFLWPRVKENKPDRFKKPDDESSVEQQKKCNSSDGSLTPLRLRFSKPSSPPNNKRTLAVRSNQSSPTAKKRIASGPVQGVMQAIPRISVPRRSRSSSFSKSSLSPISLDKQKGVFIEEDVAGPSCSNELYNDGAPGLIKPDPINKRSRSQYFCFYASGQSVKAPVSRQRQGQSYKCPIVSVA